MHVEELLAPTTAEYDPTPHFIQAEEPLAYVPTGHVELLYKHEVDPSVENLPASQTTQEEELVPPAAAEYVPAGHLIHSHARLSL